MQKVVLNSSRQPLVIQAGYGRFTSKNFHGVSFMTPEELEVAIESTRVKIHELRQQIEATKDLEERHRLKRQLNELQILQLWHLDQLG